MYDSAALLVLEGAVFAFLALVWFRLPTDARDWSSFSTFALSMLLPTVVLPLTISSVFEKARLSFDDQGFERKTVFTRTRVEYHEIERVEAMWKHIPKRDFVLLWHIYIKNQQPVILIQGQWEDQNSFQIPILIKKRALHARWDKEAISHLPRHLQPCKRNMSR